MNTTKQCKLCNKIKNISEFGKNKISKDGYRFVCKPCNCSSAQNYRRSKDGLVTSIYGNQIHRSKNKLKIPIGYNKEELKEWLFSQKLFDTLYEKWIKKDFQKEYVPSVDRINYRKGYTMSNIQLMTWAENDFKGRKEKRSK